MKKIKLEYSLAILTFVNFLAMLIGFFMLGNNVPIHFNGNMIVDKMGSPWLVIVLSIIPILCSIGLFIEIKVRGKDYENLKVLKIVLFSIIFLFIYIDWFMFSVFASGLNIGDKYQLSLALMIGLPLGVIFLTMGNYSPIIKRNKTLGIKTKSTLSSDEIWTKTHRLGGILAVSSGFLIILCSILAWALKIDWIFFASIMVGVLLSSIVPIVYAKILYNKEKSKLKKDEN